jgi:hypothetical protein
MEPETCEASSGPGRSWAKAGFRKGGGHSRRRVVSNISAMIVDMDQTTSEPFGTVPQPSESFGNVPNHSEDFGKLPNLSERRHARLRRRASHAPNEASPIGASSIARASAASTATTKSTTTSTSSLPRVLSGPSRRSWRKHGSSGCFRTLPNRWWKKSTSNPPSAPGGTGADAGKYPGPASRARA